MFDRKGATHKFELVDGERANHPVCDFFRIREKIFRISLFVDAEINQLIPLESIL
jgi:hypothetical protein